MKEKVYLSVIMAEYNTKPEQLCKSIESVLNQTYRFFELIIVDDCGKNDVEKIVSKYNDDRIKIIKNKKNIGLAQSLNKGIKGAKYDYIIRMDTDDICFLDRFEKQITFALNHPEYSIIGGNHVYFDENGEYPSKFEFSGEVNKKNFLYSTPFSHPTLLLKKNDLINSGGYPNYRRGQDYAMEMQMYLNGYKGFVMNDTLIKYRQDIDGYKKKNYKSRILEYKIRKKYFKELQLPWYRVFYIVKPLIAGIIPKKILKKYHEVDIKNIKIIKALKHPSYLLVYLNNRGFHFLPDKQYLELVYKLQMKKKLNLENPKTFNEKLQWLKLYDRNPEYTRMVDKYEVRDYIKEKIGEEYLIPLIGVYDRFDDIDFEKLPNQFVIKCTHDSGSVIICKNKNNFDYKVAKKKINKSLKRNYYYSGREWPYKNIKPRIIIEKYIKFPGKLVPEDYKVYCFNGKPQYIVVFHNRFTEDLSETVYNINWEPQHISLDEHFKVSDFVEPKPSCLSQLLSISEKLSNGISQSRIDFYIVDEKIYFGEITLYTAGGLAKMIPEEMDEKLGELIKLPIKQNVSDKN